MPQVQLLTVLVRLEEVPPAQVRDVYKLLLDDSYAVRHAAAELVTDMLEESGQRHLAQVIILIVTRHVGSCSDNIGSV